MFCVCSGAGRQTGREERMQHRFGGQWTVEKLDALRAYLVAYKQALKNTRFNLLYIDAFAGTGDRTSTRQEAATLLDIPQLDEMAKGSARVALEIEPPFGRYIFIEKQQSKSGALEQLKAEFPNRAISILNDDANTAVQRVCRETNWQSHRAVLFLDPYGMQVSWATLETVAATKAIDVWMLYPTGMGLNRLLTNDGEIPPEWQLALDRSLGCSEWREHFYRIDESLDLFGETTIKLIKDAGADKFEAFLLDRLRAIFVGVAPAALPLKNSRGLIMYLLCFACGNERGSKLANRIALSVINRRRR